MSNRVAASSWPSLAGLLGGSGAGAVGLVGAPLAGGSVTPGRCDLAPTALRNALPRISTYDLATRTELATVGVHDYGDLALSGLTPAEASTPIRIAVRDMRERHRLVIVIGGNNAVTHGLVHGCGDDLERIGLITLDAHYDLRDLDGGLANGNPVRALIDDGLPGRNVVQIGLAPFANTRAMHDFAREHGLTGYTIDQVRAEGIDTIVRAALAKFDGRCERIVVDADIDVIDRAQCPGAPGARPGGLAVSDFFRATRRLLADPRVVAVDLVEFDPSLDFADITALTAARWLAEALAGAAPRLTGA